LEVAVAQYKVALFEARSDIDRQDASPRNPKQVVRPISHQTCDRGKFRKNGFTSENPPFPVRPSRYEQRFDGIGWTNDRDRFPTNRDVGCKDTHSPRPSSSYFR
jgi:hypothetical protein